MDTHDTTETEPTITTNGAITGTATETTGEGEPAALSGDGPQEPAQAEDDPAVFPAEYVSELRHENGKLRLRAKEAVADANQRLTRAYASQDGRLVDADLVPLSDDLLDDNGLVDPAKVTQAIDALLAAKPHLRSHRPTAPLPGQGLTPHAPVELGWVDVLRGARG